MLALCLFLAGAGFGCAHSHEPMMDGQNGEQEFPEEGGEDEAGRDHSGGDPRFYRDSD
jgi:hypothetical protein